MHLHFALFGFALLTSAVAAHANSQDCQALNSYRIPQAAIRAETVSDSFTPPAEKPLQNLPSFCRVQLTLAPSADSSIKVEVWLPSSDWNGKIQGVGNGGFAGAVNYNQLAGAIRAHSAGVGTDTGHTGRGEDAAWALHHPEKIKDFGYRAVHLMTVDAKLLAKAFYHADPRHAYFSSCSDGGREALMEAQRFPDDYDGIIAGAPAYFWTHMVSNGVVNLQAMYKTSGSYLPAAKLPAIQNAAQAACDAGDGTKDGLIENPAKCHFNTSVLLCQGTETDACLTTAQLETLNQLYDGSRFSDGSQLYPGFAPGGEAAKNNWDIWITGPGPKQSLMYAFGTQFFGNMVFDNPQWNFQSFQINRDVKLADNKVAADLNATNPNLKPFFAKGGKLILYHGWDDAAISPYSTIDYFKSIKQNVGANAINQSARLFMVPGMAHCFGGNGATSFGQFSAGADGDAEHDVDAALVEWVEQGKAPEQFVAVKPGSGITHRLCAYPATAHYNGNADQKAASSYVCAIEK